MKVQSLILKSHDAVGLSVERLALEELMSIRGAAGGGCGGCSGIYVGCTPSGNAYVCQLYDCDQGGCYYNGCAGNGNTCVYT